MVISGSEQHEFSDGQVRRGVVEGSPREDICCARCRWTWDLFLLPSVPPRWSWMCATQTSKRACDGAGGQFRMHPPICFHSMCAENTHPHVADSWRLSTAGVLVPGHTCHQLRIPLTGTAGLVKTFF